METRPLEVDVWVGATRRLDRSHGHWFEKPEVQVDYLDSNGETQTVTFCADGARALARELNYWAKLIDPPKPRRTRRTSA